MSRKHKSHKFFIVNQSDNNDFCGLRIPKGAVCGRMTVEYHGKKEEVCYAITDFHVYWMSDLPQFNMIIKDNHGNWIKTNSARRAPWRQVAQRLYNIMMQYGMLSDSKIPVGTTSLDKEEREKYINKLIGKNCPHERRVRQFVGYRY